MWTRRQRYWDRNWNTIQTMYKQQFVNILVFQAIIENISECTSTYKGIFNTGKTSNPSAKCAQELIDKGMKYKRKIT